MRRPLTAALGAIIVLSVVVVATRPDLAPGAWADAKAAAADPIWRIHIDGIAQRAKWTDYARPRWMPWQPTERKTTVGRHFDVITEDIDVVDEWRRQAEQLGWTHARPCPSSIQVERSVCLSKILRGRSATLTIERNALTPIVTVAIAVLAR